MHGTQMPSEISFSDGIVLFPEFKVKQRSRRRSDSRIRRLFAEQVFRSWENVGYEYPTYNAETFLQTALFCFPNPKRNNAIGVGRILETDACSQNKFFRGWKNVGYGYPTYNALGRLNKKRRPDWLRQNKSQSYAWYTNAV